MVKRVEVKTELTADELHEKYRQATDAVERTHWHILWLVKKGQGTREIVEQLGYSPGWIRTIVRRWNEAGSPGIIDHRREQPGAKPLLSLHQQAELAATLEKPPSDGGLWTGPKVATWMQEQLGRPVDARRGWDYLQHLHYSSRVPRREHAKADKQQQETFKKLPEEVEALQQSYPQTPIELWSSDEHRIGLKPILRRVWAPKGSAVKAIIAQRYQWMYVYAFVHPESGQTTWLLLPTVSIQALSQALSIFAREAGVASDKRVVLVLDRAGWHKSPHLEVPEGIHLLFLPPYSPQLQPAERLWPLSNEPLANRCFTSLDELEQVQAERCRWLQTHPEVIRGRTSYHWWPCSLNTT